MKIEHLINYINHNPLMNITILSGIILAIAGLFTLKFPPKNINYLYGYRTNSSMKSQDRWDFAQQYSSKEMIKLGILLVLSAIIGLFITNDSTTNMLLGLGLQITTIIILFYRVERAIKSKFNKE